MTRRRWKHVIGRLVVALILAVLLVAYLSPARGLAQADVLRSRVAVFEIIGGNQAQHDAIAEKARSCTYPWARLLPHIRKWDRTHLPVYIESFADFELPGAGGYADRIGSAIHLNETLDPDRAGQVFINEAAHVVDAATFTRADQEAIMALVSPATEDWLTWNVPYSQRAGEAFMAYFDHAFSDGFLSLNWGGYYTLPESSVPAVRQITLDALADEPMPFTDWQDVTLDDEVERAAALGLIQGHADGSFDPQGQLTREQAAALLVRLYDALAGQE